MDWIIGKHLVKELLLLGKGTGEYCSNIFPTKIVYVIWKLVISNRLPEIVYALNPLLP